MRPLHPDQMQVPCAPLQLINDHEMWNCAITNGLLGAICIVAALHLQSCNLHADVISARQTRLQPGCICMSCCDIGDNAGIVCGSSSDNSPDGLMCVWQTCILSWVSLALPRSSKSKQPSGGKRLSTTLISERVLHQHYAIIMQMICIWPMECASCASRTSCSHGTFW